MSVPVDHPRYRSLVARHKLEEGLADGITTPTGLIAHGRGEALDYLLGERTHDFAMLAIEASAALLLLAKQPIISINGNTAVLVSDELVELARTVPCQLEINLFYDAPSRRQKIAAHFRALGIDVLGECPDGILPNLSSARAKVDSKGILTADVVLVSLEDGDRTEALVKAGKRVIAIDLNPLSRTPQTANISIIDNVDRAIPLLSQRCRELKGRDRSELERTVSCFNNPSTLEHAVLALRRGI